MVLMTFDPRVRHRYESYDTVELADAGFPDASLIAVEGFAHLLPDLPTRMADPDPLLSAVRLTESEPSMLGASPHVMAIASVPSVPSNTA
jgi:hypothetical protein